MSATFAGDRWVQVLSTGGKLTGCGGGTKAVKRPVSPQHHSPTTADQSAAKFHHLPANKHSTPDLIVDAVKKKKQQKKHLKLACWFSSLLTCEVGGAKEVMWQRFVCNHGPGQLFQLRQVSQHATEPRNLQTAVVVHHQCGETSQLAYGGQQMSGVTGELHVTEGKLCQLMTERKQEVIALQGSGAAGDG